MIEIYASNDCVPCKAAEEWMDEHGISYSNNGIDDDIDEYPTFIIDGVMMAGFGDTVKKAILESDNHG